MISKLYNTSFLYQFVLQIKPFGKIQQRTKNGGTLKKFSRKQSTLDEMDFRTFFLKVSHMF